MIDVEKLRQNTDIVELIGGYTELKKNGKEYTGLCPFHSEKTPSFTVVPQKHFYHCFGCGAHGDVIGFIQEIHNVDFKEACSILGGEQQRPDRIPAARPVPAAAPEWTAVCPVPKTAPTLFEQQDGQTVAHVYNPKRAGTEKEWTKLRPAKIYEYTNESDQLMGFVLRIEFQDGSKFTPQVTFCSNAQGAHRWCMAPMPEPRPLYGLAELIKRPQATVVVVEGEKAKEAAARLLENYVTVSAPGGTNGINHADWRPLYGRDVLLWPDADAPGLKAMISDPEGKRPTLADQLRGNVSRLRWLDPTGKPDGWDAADAEHEGWTAKDVIAWAKQAVRTEFPTPVKSGAPAAGSAEASTDTKKSSKSDADTEPRPQRRTGGPRGVVVSTPEGNTVKEHMPAPKEPLPTDLIGLWQQLRLQNNGRGSPYQNLDNAVRILMAHPELAGHIWFDEFHGRYLTDWRSDNGPREWSDADALLLAVYLQREIGMVKMGDDLAWRAVMTVGHQTIRNEPRDWMNTLRWDRVSRLDRFLSAYFGADETEFNLAAGRNFWISMIARIYNPGCQVDNMLVLESEQGRFKSSALNIIGGKWYAEAHESVTNKDFFMALQGVMLMEIGELDSFSRAETTKVKQVITCRADRYRMPYGRVASNHPRRNVFVGSTNQDAYLMDATGARRFWPVKCGFINLDALREDRSQLFAEAVALYKANHPWWNVPEQEARAIQESRRSSDAWEDRISDYLNGREFTTINEVLEVGLDIEINKADRRMQLRVADALRVLGYERAVIKNQTREGWQSQRGWRKKKSDRLPFQDE